MDFIASKYYYVSVAVNLKSGLHSILSYVVKKHPLIWIKERQDELEDEIPNFHSVTIISWQEISEAEYNLFNK